MDQISQGLELISKCLKRLGLDQFCQGAVIHLKMFKRLGSDHPRGWMVHADRPRERTVHADHPRGCTVRADHLRGWTVRADRPRGRTVHADRPRGRRVRAVCQRLSLPNSLNKSVRPNGTQLYHIDVVTHPLADFDFHEDRQHPLWFLMGSS